MFDFNLPENFLRGNVYILVNDQNIHHFVDTLEAENIPYYEDIVAFVTKWAKAPGGCPACFFDITEKTVHINGMFNSTYANVEIYTFDELCTKSVPIDRFLDLI